MTSIQSHARGWLTRHPTDPEPRPRPRTVQNSHLDVLSGVTLQGGHSNLGRIHDQVGPAHLYSHGSINLTPMPAVQPAWRRGRCLPMQPGSRASSSSSRGVARLMVMGTGGRHRDELIVGEDVASGPATTQTAALLLEGSDAGPRRRSRSVRATPVEVPRMPATPEERSVAGPIAPR